MSTAAFGSAHAAIWRALAAASRLQGAESYGQACAALEQALPREPADDPPADDRDAVLLHAESWLVLAECATEADEMARAEPALERIARLLSVLDVAARPRGLEGRLALCRARACFLSGDVDAAIRSARTGVEALSYDDSLAVHQSIWLLRAQAVLAATLSIAGHHAESIEIARPVLARLNSPGLRGFGRDRVRVAMNLASALSFSGDLDAAAELYRHVVVVSEGDIAAGCELRLHDLGRALTNLASTLLNLDRHAEALVQNARADALYANLLVRLRRRGARVARVEASRAINWMNWGYTHYRAGQHDQAARQLGRASRYYRRLRMASPMLLDDEARTWVNQAHVLMSSGRPQAAVRRARAALGRFERRVADGTRYVERDLANTCLSLGRALAAAGNPRGAAEQTLRGLHRYALLAGEGQIQHAISWLDGFVLAVDVLLVSPGAKDATDAALSTLGATLASTPGCGHPVGEESLRAIDRAAGRSADWSMRADWLGTALDGLSQALARSLLSWMASLLSDVDPVWMTNHAGALAGSTARLWQLTRALPGADLLQVDWFLGTRGLRAQRDALLSSTDPLVIGLAALQRQLWRLEQDQLARSLGMLRRPDDALPPAGGQRQPTPPAEDDMASQAEWAGLRLRCETQRACLAADGVLPARVRVDAKALCADLPERTALCLLARPRPDTLLVLLLWRDAGAGSCVLAADVTLDAATADVGFEGLLALVRRDALLHAGAARTRGRAAAVLPAPGLGPAGFVAASLDTVGRQVQAAIGSAWVQAGCHSLVIVPSDDLHLVPWRHLLRPWLGDMVQLAQYPSVGAWLAAQRNEATGALMLRRWAEAIDHFALDDLAWLEVERDGSRAIWAAHGVGADTLASVERGLDGIDGLLAMGHGGLPTPGRPGDGLAYGRGRVLSAHDLPKLRHARCVLLSCCVLGQIHDAFGEPLGFLAEAFGYGVRFGYGWLTEVPDDLACLFALALQHEAARRAECTGGGLLLQWLAAFDATCDAVGSGRWPPGFERCLRSTILCAGRARCKLPDDWQDRPPVAMQRLLPWVVALGR